MPRIKRVTALQAIITWHQEQGTPVPKDFDEDKALEHVAVKKDGTVIYAPPAKQDDDDDDTIEVQAANEEGDEGASEDGDSKKKETSETEGEGSEGSNSQSGNAKRASIHDLIEGQNKAPEADPFKAQVAGIKTAEDINKFSNEDFLDPKKSKEIFAQAAQAV